MKKRCFPVLLALLLAVGLAMPAAAFHLAGTPALGEAPAVGGLPTIGGETDPDRDTSRDDAREEEEINWDTVERTQRTITQVDIYDNPKRIIEASGAQELWAAMEENWRLFSDCSCTDPESFENPDDPDHDWLLPVTLPISWDLNSVDFARGGLQYMTGAVELGPVLDNSFTYVLGEGAENVVYYPVYVPGQVAPEDVVPIAYVEQYGRALCGNLTVGADAEAELPAQLEHTQFTCHMNGVVQSSYDCTVTWDFLAVDTSQPGLYTLPGTPDVPAGLCISDEMDPVTADIGVTSTTGIDLSGAMYVEMFQQISCQFAYLPEDPYSVCMEISTDGGTTWRSDPPLDDSDPESALFWDYARYNREDCVIDFYLSYLDEGVDYAFRMVYDGGRISNVLYIRPGDVPVFNAPSTSGDVDGGDQGEQELPDFTQPAPDPDSGHRSSRNDDDDEGDPPTAAKPETTQETIPLSPLPEAEPERVPASPEPSEDAAKSDPPGDASPPAQAAPADVSVPPPSPISTVEPVLEVVTDDDTVMSGVRLRAMAELSDTVFFEKHGVAVSFSSGFLLELAPLDSDLLTVTITKPTPDSFSVSVEGNDTPVTQLAQTTVRLSWEGEDSALICVDADGNFVSDVVFEPAGIAACTITVPGVYTIRAAEHPAALAAGVSDAKDVEIVETSASEGVSPNTAWQFWLLPTAGVLALGVLAVLRKKRHG